MSRHDTRVRRTLSADTDNDLDPTDPEIQRVLDAIHESSPSSFIAALDDDGLHAMLHRMVQGFNGRPLDEIPRSELVDIARTAVDEALDLPPLPTHSSRPNAPAIPKLDPPPSSRNARPAPEVLDIATATIRMSRVAVTVQAWRDGAVDAAEAAAETRRILDGTS